ncbi:ATP-binding protein [Streptomyces cadmiisoli]|uniref:ATP-binding protein n=1 Tax=Streptomyces cadmiisoli TaxID=2184053 RepID=UPI003D754D0B
MGNQMIGRDEEMRVLRRMLSEAAAGDGGALLVHGTAGVGKSTLLRTFGTEAAAAGFKVLRTSGVQTEQWMPLAALQLLLQPVARGIDDLPDPHRQALGIALGNLQTEPEIFRVGLAVLELLADAAVRQPLLLLVDDLQWIDSASRDVIRFVARRTRDLAILAVGAARTQPFDSPWQAVYSELGLEPLDAAAAAELLDASAPGLPAHLRDLILERAAGNPLALIELPKAAQGRTARTDSLPLTRRLEDAFAARTDSVSQECRAFLLALAVESTAPLNLLLDVASRLCDTTVSVEAVQEAVDAGLITLVGRIPEFGHALMRSAIYTRASVAERLATHRAMAVALEATPERQLAHLAKAAFGPDEELAGRLERFADESQARGKTAAAVPALVEAAQLVLDESRRAGLLVRAAELSSEVDDGVHTQVLLERARTSTLGPVERARLLLVSDRTSEVIDPNRQIQDMVTAAGGAFDAGGTDAAENLLWRASARCFFHDGNTHVRAQTAAELDRWNPDPNAPHVLMVRGFTHPYQYGADVLARLDDLRVDRADGRVLHFLGSAAMAVGDLHRATQYWALAASAWRSQGRLSLLARSLAGAWPRVYFGQLERVREESAEGLTLAEETGEKAWMNLKATAGLVAALRGESEEAARTIGALRARSLFAHVPFVAARAQQTDALLALFEGHADRAYDLLARAFDPTDLHYHSVSRWLLAPDLADAAVAAGTVPQARELLSDLAELAGSLPSEMIVTAHAYTRAVLATDDTAEERYAAALGELPAHWTLLRARLRLHHGRRLRRQRRNVDARNPLRTARDEFDRIGAQPWADLAREQLRAAGEANVRRQANTSELLSAQEMQVAELAAQGLSNREIGQRLFISHRTVGAHLYRIYPRLGITSRGRLAAALATLHEERPAAHDAGSTG